jgi:hypothetical protein
MSDISNMDEALRQSNPRSVVIRLIEALSENIEVIIGSDGEAYAATNATQKHVVVPIDSQAFRDFVHEIAYDEKLTFASGQVLDQIAAHFRTHARRTHQREAIFTRIGFLDGTLFFDRCTADNSIIEITTKGVRVQDTSPVRFLRSSSMRELPTPDRKGSLNELRSIIPHLSEEDFRLLLGALIALAHPHGPTPGRTHSR